jgi:hypothetical protein
MLVPTAFITTIFFLYINKLSFIIKAKYLN